jgi:hypothetical protein
MKAALFNHCSILLSDVQEQADAQIKIAQN